MFSVPLWPVRDPFVHGTSGLPGDSVTPGPPWPGQVVVMLAWRFAWPLGPGDYRLPRENPPDGWSELLELDPPKLRDGR